MATTPAFRRFAYGTFAVAGAAVLSVTQPANAQYSYNMSAKSGVSQRIDSYHAWNADCSFRTVSVDVVSPPGHGTVTPKVEAGTVKQAHVGTTGACLGKPTKAVSVYYRSARGYRGKDGFKVRMTIAGFPPVFYTYSIDVR